MANIIPISEHFQHFLAEMKESFWGDLYGQTKLSWQRFFELQSERQRDRYAGLGTGRTAAWPTASLSQRLLRAGFCDPLRHHPAAGCAYSREELSAPWFATVSAAGGGGFAVDPGGIFARDQHAAGGAGSGHPDRRSGERADGLETDPRSGRGGSPVSPGPAKR